jgi:hypothetical protein
VRNLRRDRDAPVRIADRRFAGRARFIDDPVEDARAREIVASKYGELDSDWWRTALPVAIDLSEI